jgi:hypothetical protein
VCALEQAQGLDTDPTSPSSRWKRAHQKTSHHYQAIAAEFCNVLIDIPCIAAALFVGGTLVHIPFLYGKFKRITREDASYRTPFEEGEVQVAKKWEWSVRAACFKHAGLALFDIVTCVVALLVFGTLWRAYPLYKSLKKSFKPKRKGADPEDPPPKPNLKKARVAVFKHFGFLLVDLVAMPFFLVTLCSWRSKSLVSAIVGTGDVFGMFAVMTFVEFGRYCVDVPLFLVFVVTAIFRSVTHRHRPSDPARF